jgi:hypothetical protein
MKVNKWTLGLAALGLVSMPAAGLAEENMSQVWTAVSSTTISGYVNTSVHWNTGTGNDYLPGYAFNNNKADGFNLDVVNLRIERPLDEAQWAAGYKVDLLFGPDANSFGTGSSSATADDGADTVGLANTSDFGIKQAYVALRAPVGNGLDFKVGVWDTILGYETFDAGGNPNYTRSYGYTIEPTTHTGVLASYQVNHLVSFSAGIANTHGPKINEKANPPRAESYKTYTGAVALTAPEEWGFMSGSTLYAGFMNGFGSGLPADQVNWYVGVVMNTPVEGFRVGASFDYLGTTDEDAFGGPDSAYANAWALYASFQATEKLSFHLRGEYASTDTGLLDGSAGTAGINGNAEVFALTTTLQYDLWRNVISRLEMRWDHQAGDGDMMGWGDGGRDSVPNKRNNVLVAANLIYQF